MRARLRSCLIALPLLAACTEDLGPTMEAPRDNPSLLWAGLLRRSSTPDGVDYDMIARNRSALDRYMAWIAVHGPISDEMRESQEDKRLAFRLNAYNAAVIYAVLAHRPLSNVRDLRHGIWQTPGTAFFLGQRFRIDGEWIDLYHLEHQYIAAAMQEPLVHAALNCASKSCPRARWFDERKLQRTLEEAMRFYLSTEHGLRGQGEGYAASEIFRWYAEDFTDWSDADTVCAWMIDYVPIEAKPWFEANAEECPLEWIPYDWSLNDIHVPTSNEREKKEAARREDAEDNEQDGVEDTGKTPR